MGFDIKRAESIAYGFKEWIHKGQISYDLAVDQIKKTYREDMAREIIRILDKELKEAEEKCRWALVFTDVEEAEKAREKLSWRNIYPDSQVGRTLFWIEKEQAERAREHVGGLIEPRYRGAAPAKLFEEAEKAEIAEAAEREYGGPLLPPTPENAKENIRRVVGPRLKESAKTKILVQVGYSYPKGELRVDRDTFDVGPVSITGFGDTVKEEVERVFGPVRYTIGGFREETFENEKVKVDYYASFGYLSITVKPK